MPSTFRIFNFDDFANYVRQTIFQRKVTVIQNHHTWLPDYHTFFHSGLSPMQMLENMRRDHIHSRGWSDIGQNITIFPDGTIGLCRALDVKPAGIFGANSGGICIESVGNFDQGKDEMTEVHRHAIINTNAILCNKFGLHPSPATIVYHHWYDRSGKRFPSVDVNSGKVLKENLQKTCPGTNFFCQPGSAKGNSIQCAVENFFPRILGAMSQLEQRPAVAIQANFKRVTASRLNVRAGKGIEFRVVRKLSRGIQIPVFETATNWSRINLNAEEWVSSKYLA